MSAAFFLLRHRRVVAIQLWFSGLAVVAWPVFRFATSSADLDGALRSAQAQVDELQPVIGEEFDLAAAFVEPRYLAAEKLPFDLAALSVGLALVCFLAGAVLCGGDWRSRAVQITWVSPGRRGRPAAVAVASWTGWCAAVAVVVLVVAAAALLTVARLRGMADGIGPGAVLLIVLRGTLVVACAGAVGAGAGIAARSEVVVTLGLLGYVILGELLAPALMAANGYRSGGTRLIEFVVSEAADSRSNVLACLAPRCPDLVVPGGGPIGGYVAVGGAVALALVLAWLVARRPVWR